MFKNMVMYATDEAEATSEAVKTDENVDTETTEEQAKTYTEEEVEQIKKGLKTQEEVDEIVKKRLAREKEKFEAEKKENERLSKLSEKERQAEEDRKKDEEIARLKAEIQRKELEEDTIDRLNSEGLPLAFKSFLMGVDAETTNQNVIDFKKAWETALEETVNKKIQGRTVKAPGSPQSLDVFQQISKRYKKGE